MTRIEPQSNDRIRIEQGAGCDYWTVVDDEVKACEHNNYGRLADGFPEEDAARAWVDKWRLDMQCREWEMHSRQDDPEEEVPF